MNKIKKPIHIVTAFMLYALFAASILTAAPSKEVTDQLIAGLQDIRKNLAHEAIELFEDKDTAPDLPWEETLCRHIVNENQPTQLSILTNDIKTILSCIRDAHESIKVYSHHVGPRITYSYSEKAERILRLQLYCTRFMDSVMPYINSFDDSEREGQAYRYFSSEYRNKLYNNTDEQRHFMTRQTRDITTSYLNDLEISILCMTYLLAEHLKMHSPQENITHTTQASAPAAESHKRTNSNDSDEDEKVTKDPKRPRINEEDDDDDTEAEQAIRKKLGLLALLRSHTIHQTSAGRKRSDVMAHQGIRNNIAKDTKKECQLIARTMVDQAEKLHMLNSRVAGNSIGEQRYLVAIPSQLWAYQEENGDILYAPEITHNAKFMLTTAQKISANISDLEANHVKRYAQNIVRIKQWQTHYQHVLTMGLLYLNSDVEKPDHVKWRDMLRNRFMQGLNLDVVSTLPSEDPQSIDIQITLDLQRITLANKTTRALAGIQKMHNMLDTEHNDDNDQK